MQPIIGVIACGYDNLRQFVPQTYLTAIASFGGIPLILPCCDSGNCFTYYERVCNGFLFCGGNDINPLLFGEELQTDQGVTDSYTDSFHISFMKHALKSHLPILAICRGMQVLNIALGGTIYQDLSLRPDPSLNHMQLSCNRSDTSHKIAISKSSLLYDIFHDMAYVNSFHHQCIHSLGEGLRVTAIASDGVIEAIEATSPPFTLGVQWHPECMLESLPAAGKLFSTFIAHAQNAKELTPII